MKSKLSKSKQQVSPIPFVIKKNFIAVSLPGSEVFTLHSSHQTFDQLAKALRNKQWKKIPQLVSLAAQLEGVSHGDIEVKRNKVYYKGIAVNPAITQRIVAMAKKKKDILPAIKFLNNLYKNPSREAREEFFQWLNDNDLPITDTGCFLAYKSVNNQYRDTHSNTIDNHPGQVIFGSRDWFDNNYRTQCSSGFHICSKHYGIYGDRTMAVLVNPRDVLSAEGGKMRVVRYEVLKELGRKRAAFQREGYPELENQIVIELGKERGEVLSKLLAKSAIKKAIKQKKLSKKSLVKASFARLRAIAQRYGITKVEPVGPEDSFALKKARVAAGLSIGQVAKASGKSYKTIAKLEAEKFANEAAFAVFAEAIHQLTTPSKVNRGVSYPQAVCA